MSVKRWGCKIVFDIDIATLRIVELICFEKL